MSEARAGGRCLAVIPARGGSKGIPGKNIQPVAGKPLLAYAIECLLDSGADLDIAVSSDSERILDVAREYGGVRALRRPDSISGDRAATEDALIDALDRMEAKTGAPYDAVLTVQPTSPFRTPGTVRGFLARWAELREEGGCDAMLTLHESVADHWVRDDAGFRRLFPDEPRRRQGRRPVYVEDSCLYITAADALRETRSVLGHSVDAYVIDEREALDINEPVDLEYARWLMGENGPSAARGPIGDRAQDRLQELRP